MSKVHENKIGIIGLGRMGKCLVSGLLRAQTIPTNQLFFTSRQAETGKESALKLGIQRCESNVELVDACDTIVLAVKPQTTGEVFSEIQGRQWTGKTIVSVAASVTTAQIEQGVGGEPAVVRAMPNTPAFVGAAMTPLCLGAYASEEDLNKAKAIFSPVGKVVQTEERLMDAVTGLSGCGPAYTYVVLESLTEAGIKVGLPRDLAKELASQTVLGAAKMLMETGKHPAALKDEVTTPAGCTIDGLVELEEGKLRVTLIKAVVSATKRAQKLSKP